MKIAKGIDIAEKLFFAKNMKELLSKGASHRITSVLFSRCLKIVFGFTFDLYCVYSLWLFSLLSDLRDLIASP